MFIKEITIMSFENYFPLWNDLNTAQKKLISDNLITQHVKKGTIIHNGSMDCTGLLLIKSGQLRTYQHLVLLSQLYHCQIVESNQLGTELSHGLV